MNTYYFAIDGEIGSDNVMHLISDETAKAKAQDLCSLHGAGVVAYREEGDVVVQIANCLPLRVVNDIINVTNHNRRVRAATAPEIK